MRAVRWRSRALTQAADSLVSESLLAPPRAKLLARSTAPIKKPAGAGIFLAEWTGLEPATPGVTGRYSNQLNYHSAVVYFLLTPRNWWVLRGSNSRPTPCKGAALPTELSTRN